MDDKTDLALMWDRAKNRFGDNSIRPQQRAWIRLTRPVGWMDETAVLAAPNELAKEYLDRLRPLIASVLTDEAGQEVRVTVMVDDQPPDFDLEWADPVLRTLDHMDPDTGRTPAENGHGGVASLNMDNRGTSSAGLASMRSGDEWGRYPAPEWNSNGHGNDVRESRLNPKYTFDTFVIGNSNRFTHAAAVAVAEAPAKAYNPLFIYGDSGLGKTHLLHAIGHYAQRLMPNLKVRYVSTEEFTNEFINSLRDDKMHSFQARYRSVDLLLIDDIQFLQRAERTQEEFFHTFNTLHNASKQIVITSDRSPRQLSTLEDRLRTRFEWGLITDVQTPDLETRIAILRKKAAQEGMNPPPEVLEFIASKIESNIRELEGALIRVTAFASLHRQDVDMTLAENVLKDLLSESDTPEITAAHIMAVISEYFSITMEDLVGSSRSRVLVDARQIAMYLCRELTELSLPKIGEKFGGRDHTTVMHAERKIKARMAERLTIYNQIAELTSRIKLRARAIQ